MHGEALLDQAREQVVGGRAALAHDLGDVVGPDTVRVLLQEAQHLQHRARGREAAPATVLLRAVGVVTHACVHLLICCRPGQGGT